MKVISWNLGWCGAGRCWDDVALARARYHCIRGMPVRHRNRIEAVATEFNRGEKAGHKPQRVRILLKATPPKPPRTARAVLTCVLLCAPVFAGPPLVTDDPETPGRGGWEVNLSHNTEKTRDGLSMDSPLIDLNYGFRANDQFKVEFAVLSVDPEDERNHWGLSDLLIGYKYRFLDEEQAGWMASFYPQVAVPTGNRHLGLGSGSVEVLAPCQVGKHFLDDRFFVYAEVGYNVVFDDPHAGSWKYGIAGEWKATEKLEIVGEVGSFVFPNGSDPDDVFFNLGAKYKFNAHAALIGSAGRSFKDRRTGTPEFMSFVGLQFTFGGDEEEGQ